MVDKPKPPIERMAELAAEIIVEHMDISTCVTPWECPLDDEGNVVAENCKQGIRENLLKIVNERTDNDS